MLLFPLTQVRNALEAEHPPGVAAAMYAEHIVGKLAAEALNTKERELAKNDQAHKDIIELEGTVEHAQVRVTREVLSNIRADT